MDFFFINMDLCTVPLPLLSPDMKNSCRMEIRQEFSFKGRGPFVMMAGRYASCSTAFPASRSCWQEAAYRRGETPRISLKTREK